MKTIHPLHHLFIALCICSAPATGWALSLMPGAQQGMRQRFYLQWSLSSVGSSLGMECMGGGTCGVGRMGQ